MSQALYDLPEGWEWVTIADLINKKGLFTDGDWVESKDQDPDGEIRLIQLADIGVGVFRDKSDRFLTKDKALELKCSFLNEGDILFARMPDPIGRACLFPKISQTCVTVVDVSIIRPFNENVLSNWLVNVINSPSFHREVLSLQKGTTRKRISRTNLSSIKLPLPPLAEQTRIVEKLDAVLSRIDTAIDELQQSLALVDAMFKSGLDGVFAGLALLYNATALSQVVKINSGIALPSIFKESHASGAIPFYKVAQMNNHTEIMTGSDILFSSEVSKAHKVTVFPKGSVLIPKRGGAILTNKKRILVEDASYDSNIMGLKANNELISDEYLFAFMQSIDLSDFVDASTIPQINNKHVDQMMIPVPSLSEQEKAVKHIIVLTNHTTQLKTELTAKIGMFNQLKASVLDGAFRGLI